MRKALAVATTALLLVIPSTALAGGAVVTRDTVSTALFETGLTHDCRPGVTGTLTGTDITSTQSVETSTGFLIHGTNRDSGTIDWSDGTYTLINSVDHFSFEAPSNGTASFTSTHTDSGDFYSADGALQFRETFHEVEHFTVTNGVVRVELSKGRFHFFGGC